MPDTTLLAPALTWSGHLRRRVDAQPAYAEWLSAAARLPVDARALAAWFDELRQARLGGAADPSAPMGVEDCRAVLRRLRERVFCAVMVRDLAGLAPLEEVVGAMTLLADRAVREAYRSIASELAAVHGVPREAASGLPQEMLIMGMGKLGGEELNVSSDIDLVMLYGDEGDTDGPRPISHHEFYGRLTRRMMPVISEIDADGQVFRTDLRLRPDGDAGPLAWSLDAFEHYLVGQGREWERYAWLKARRIEARAFAGSDPAQQAAQIEALRRPFVYRKYFDFDALAALRALRERIRQDWNRRAHSATDPSRQADNIKLGEGGIREVEFVVQLEQLIRGGRVPALQERGLLAALHAECAAGLVDADQARRLEAAYRFLRRIEHALQYREDQQTHVLPAEPERRAALAQALGYADRAAFERELQGHREFVEATFRGVFGKEETPPTALAPPDELESLVLARIRDRLPDDEETLAPRVAALLHSARIRSLPDASQRRLAALLPAAVDASAGTPAPASALARIFDLIENIAQRSAYLALLAEYPATLARVARLFAASDWAANYLIRHPLLLDELLESRLRMEEPDIPALARRLSDDLDAATLGASGEPDVERQMNLMRDAQRQWGFQLLVQDIEGRLTVERLGDLLSMTADALLAETLKRIWPLVSKDRAAPMRFAVIAYGKHGGKELGYASDLDLVFIFDDPREDAGEVYTRFGQRILSWLGALTASGRLYEVDLRLRPDGQAGLIAISADGFERYQKEHAWVWEHQAITRARHAAGDPRVGERFEQIRREVLLMPRDPAALAAEVVNMRRKISEGHPKRGAGFDLKHGPGGMVDVEFITQFLVLRHAREHAALLDNLGNIALLRLAADAGLIPADLAGRAGDAYRALRRAQHALRLKDQDKALVPAGALAAERAAVIELWERVLGPR